MVVERERGRDEEEPCGSEPHPGMVEFTIHRFDKERGAWKVYHTYRDKKEWQEAVERYNRLRKILLEKSAGIEKFVNKFPGNRYAAVV